MRIKLTNDLEVVQLTKDKKMETTYRNQLEVDRKYLAVLGLARQLTPKAQVGGKLMVKEICLSLLISNIDRNEVLKMSNCYCKTIIPFLIPVNHKV